MGSQEVLAFTISVEIDVTFDGDYIEPDDAEYYLSDWLYSGLDDREDIVEINMYFSDPRFKKEI